MTLQVVQKLTLAVGTLKKDITIALLWGIYYKLHPASRTRTIVFQNPSDDYKVYFWTGWLPCCPELKFVSKYDAAELLVWLCVWPCFSVLFHQMGAFAVRLAPWAAGVRNLHGFNGWELRAFNANTSHHCWEQNGLVGKIWCWDVAHSVANEAMCWTTNFSLPLSSPHFVFCFSLLSSALGCFIMHLLEIDWQPSFLVLFCMLIPKMKYNFAANESYGSLICLLFKNLFKWTLCSRFRRLMIGLFPLYACLVSVPRFHFCLGVESGKLEPKKTMRVENYVDNGTQLITVLNIKNNGFNLNHVFLVNIYSCQN